MPAIDGEFCPLACRTSCQLSASYRDADGMWTTTLAITVFVLLVVDAALAAVAIYLVGTAPKKPVATATAPPVKAAANMALAG
jgi:hypothetical protein